MTRLARDVDVRPRRFVLIALRPVILSDVRRVTVRTHRVPAARPRKGLIPALSYRRRPRIPCHPQRLKPSARQPEEVLLQRIYAKRVGHIEIADGAVRPGGADDERVAAP